MNHLTNAQLVERYNAATEALSGKTGTHFRDRGTALRRTQKVARAPTLGGGATWARVAAAFGDRPRHVTEVAEETGLTPRQVRAAIDNARRRGHTIIRVDRGTFERS